MPPLPGGRNQLNTHRGPFRGKKLSDRAGKMEPWPKVSLTAKLEGYKGGKISTFYPSFLGFPAVGQPGRSIWPFPLKIKFLDKLYNAYFSAQFQTKIPYYEKKL
jgi:hypothetical protein